MTRVGHGSRSLELKGTKCGNRGNARSDTISRDGAKPQKDHAEDTYPVAAYACARGGRPSDMMLVPGGVSLRERRNAICEEWPVPSTGRLLRLAGRFTCLRGEGWMFYDDSAVSRFTGVCWGFEYGE